MVPTIDHVRAIRWKDGEFCPHCGCGRIYHFSDRKTFKCGDCRERFSIAAANPEILPLEFLLGDDPFMDG